MILDRTLFFHICSLFTGRKVDYYQYRHFDIALALETGADDSCVCVPILQENRREVDKQDPLWQMVYPAGYVQDMGG